MSKTKPVAETIFPWLRANLGKNCLGPLTGTDARALRAAVQIIDLYSYHRDKSVLEAFQKVVFCMQPHCQEFAYHAIAHVMDWSDRPLIWRAAELDVPEYCFVPRVCAFEPGGSGKEFQP